MRIISGIAKGIHLDAPSGISTRPTGERVKEGLFSALMPFIPNSKVLDMFSGSGQLALEALSRGADYAAACDSDVRACKVIKKNAARCRLDSPDKLTVICSAFDFIHRYLPEKSQFDIVFVDPPYKTHLAGYALSYLCTHNLLSEDALVAVECSSFPTPQPEGYILHREYRYGGTTVKLFKFCGG